MKKQIDLYLSGGGIKCAYQIALLETLINNKFFNDNYKIRNIHCVSFGCFVGYAFVNKKLNVLKELFLNFNQNTLKKNFALWGINLPLIGRIINFVSNIIWIFYSFMRRGFYSNKIGYDILNKIENTQIKNNKLNKLICYAFNMETSKLEQIYGNNNKIKDYIIASCSCWGLFEPKIINNMEYIDGGLEQLHPFVNLDDDNNDKKIIKILLSTVDLKTLNNVKINKSNNIIEYFIGLINYLIDTKMYKMSLDWNKPNHIIVNYTPPIETPHTIDNIKIIQMFKDGIALGNNLLLKLKNIEL